MDLFNRKKVKSLEATLAAYREKTGNLHRKINELERLPIKVNELENQLRIANERIGGLKHFSVDAVELAKSLSKYPIKRHCGAGGCGMNYQVPVHVIHTIVNKEVAKIKNDDGKV